MASVFDVAEYILDKAGYVSTMKLQKLVFYSNALSLVCDGKTLFPEAFQAWVNGPVCPALFFEHKGKFIVGPGAFASLADTSRIGEGAVALIEHVLSVLGDFDGNELSRLTHGESPWRDARKGCDSSDRCEAVISNDAIRSYYSSPQCTNPLFKRCISSV